MSKVSLLLPRYMDGGLAAMVAGDFFGSNRLKSAVDPLVGLSASIVSRATWVEAVDFLGHVPYQLLFALICLSYCQPKIW